MSEGSTKRDDPPRPVGDKPRSPHHVMLEGNAELSGDPQAFAKDWHAIAGNLGRVVAADEGEVKGVDKNGRPYSYKYAYAGLPAVLDAVRDALAEAGASLSQIPRCGTNRAGCTTLVIGSNWILRSDLTFGFQKGTPQSIGSLISYARRYSILGLFGLAPEEDDGSGDVAQQRAIVEQKQERNKADAEQGRGPDAPPLNVEKTLKAFAGFGLTEAVLKAEIGGTPLARATPQEAAHLRGLHQKLQYGAEPQDVLTEAAVLVYTSPPEDASDADAPEGEETTKPDDKPF